MKSDTGLLMNIVLGIIGAAVASAIFSFFGINLEVVSLGYLISGFVGACLLIWIEFGRYEGRAQLDPADYSVFWINCLRS